MSQSLKSPTTDTLPAGLTYVSNDCGASFASPTVTWNIGALAAAASVTCNLTVTVTQGGTIVNTASISSGQTDPTPGNNTGSGSLVASMPDSNRYINMFRHPNLEFMPWTAVKNLRDAVEVLQRPVADGDALRPRHGADAEGANAVGHGVRVHHVADEPHPG